MKYEINWKHVIEVPDSTTRADAAREALRVLRSGQIKALFFDVREADTPHAHTKQIFVDAGDEYAPSLPDQLSAATTRDEEFKQMLIACYNALTPILGKGKEVV